MRRDLLNPTLWAIPAMWLEAYLVCSAGGSVVIALFAACALTLRMCIPAAAPIGRVSQFAMFLGIVLLVGFTGLFQETNVRGDFVFPVLLTRTAAEILLLLQVLAVLPRPPSERLPAYYPWLVLGTVLFAFNQTFGPSQRSLHLTLAVAGAAACGLLSLATSKTRAYEDAAAGSRRLRIALVLVGAWCGAWAVASVWQNAATQVQVLVPGWIANAAGRNDAASAYVRTGSLESITREKLNDPQGVALRVYADKAPGYLRGRAFDYYFQSQWRSATRSRNRWDRMSDKQIIKPLSEPPADLPAPAAGKNLFAIHEASDGPFARMEVHNLPNRGEMFFLPLTASYVEGEGAFLAVDVHQSVHTGIKSNAAYTAYAVQGPLESDLGSPLRERLLTPPLGVDAKVRQLARDVCRDARSPQGKIESVSAFFQNNFRYSLEGFDAPRGVEPLSYFLLNRPAAHCEFFASGAVTLLRLEGVPCRYVTGYVVTELESEYGDYWLARNQNAHAWVEAFDESRGRWVLVEATPGMVLPRDDESRTADSTSTAANAQAGSNVWLDQRWFDGRWEAMLAWPQYPLLIGFSLCAVAVIGYRKWLRRWRANSAAGGRLYRMRRQLSLVDRRLRRRHLVRRPGETLHQFAGRIRRDAGGDAQLLSCADWYVEYARVRYSDIADAESPLPIPL